MCLLGIKLEGSLEEKPMLVTTEPPLLPHCFPLTIHNTARERNHVAMEVIIKKKLEFQDLKGFRVAKN